PRIVASKFLNVSSDSDSLWCRNDVESQSRKVTVCQRPGRSVFGRLPTALRGNRRAKGRYSIDGLSVMLLAIAPRIILLHEIDPPSHRIRNHRHPAFHRLGTGTGSRPAATACVRQTWPA